MPRLSNAETVTDTVDPTYIPWRDRPRLQMQTAAKIAGVSVASLYKLHDKGRLRLRRSPAGRTLVDTQSLIILIEADEPYRPLQRGEEARAQRQKNTRRVLR